MLDICDNGRVVGSVSGGRIEDDLIDGARRQGITRDPEQQSGQAGGVLKNLVWEVQATVMPFAYQGFARKASAFMPGMDSAEAAGFHWS